MPKKESLLAGAIGLALGALLVPKVEAGKFPQRYGFNMFESRQNITSRITVYAAWTDLDLSDLIPDYATGVVLAIENLDVDNGKMADFRKNGSTDDFYATSYLHRMHHQTIYVGVDSNRVLEYCVQTQPLPSGWLDTRTPELFSELMART